MAKTGAERQRELRARRQRMRVGPGVLERDRSEGEMCLSIWVRTSAYLALQKVAAARGSTVRETLEALLMRAGDELVTG